MRTTSGAGSGLDRSSPEVREALAALQNVVAPVSRNQVDELALAFVDRPHEEVAAEVDKVGNELVEMMLQLDPSMSSAIAFGMTVAFFDLVRARMGELQPAGHA